jgi:hypothetical protein
MITRTHRVVKFGAVIALSLTGVFASSAAAMASPVGHDRIAAHRYLNGSVTMVTLTNNTPTSITILPVRDHRAPVTVALSPSTVYRQLKATATVSALLVGSYVQITATGDPLTASIVHVSAPPADVTIGQVTAVTTSTVTVQPQTSGSAPVTFLLTSNTSYFANRHVATINQVNQGDVVRIAASPSAATTAVFVTVRDRTIVGRVTKIDGSVISVTGVHGAALSVIVTPRTVYRHNGHRTGRWAIRRGEFITAVGPATSGTTTAVTATTLRLVTKDHEALRRAMIQRRDKDDLHN